MDKNNLASYQGRLESIRKEWDKAELDIKQAEQVCDEVVMPSIMELRYAGRRIAEILYLINTGDPDNKIDGLLHDATFDCHRARHDAIDAATAKIAADLAIALKAIGPEAVLKACPSFPQIRKEVLDLRKKIKASRHHRENREAIYSVLEDSDFIELCDSFGQFQASEDLMKELAANDRRAVFRSNVFGYGGIFIGAAGIIVGIIIAA